MEFPRSCPLFLASFGQNYDCRFNSSLGMEYNCIIWIFCRESELVHSFLKTVHSQLDSSTKADDKTDLTHVRVFILTIRSLNFRMFIDALCNNCY